MSATASPRADIQGLRAVAVLAVLADHVFGHPAGGFVGVDIFFVISGYLITGLLFREHKRTGTISWRGFYRRRVKRIVPAAALVLVTTVIAGRLLLPATRSMSAATDALWSALFVGNWRFALGGTDYFAQGLPPSPLQHFWSLGVEEQFYIVWPWLMLGVYAVCLRRLRWSRLRTRALIAGIVLGLGLLSFAWAMHDTRAHQTVAYFSTLSRAWELAAGALIAVLGPVLAAPRLTSLPAVRNRSVLGWVGLAGIALSLFVVPADSGFPAPWALLPVASAALVIAAGHGVQLSVRPLTHPVSRYIGDISYSLYLWHWPIAVLLVQLVPRDGLRYHVFALVLIAALATTSYHLLEDPVRRSRWLEPRRPADPPLRRQIRRQQLVGSAALAAALIGLAVFALQPGPAAPALTASSQPGATANPCLGAGARNPQLHCPVAPLGAQVLPAVDQVAKDYRGAYDCWIAQNEPLRSCTYGSTRPDARRVALVGDSHAAMLLPALKSELAQLNWRLDTYVGWGCQWMPPGNGSLCDNAMIQAQQRLAAGPRYDIVLTSAARTKTGRDKAHVSNEMVRAWQPVARRGTEIVVVADNPVVSQQALDCLSRVSFDPRKDSCSTPRADAVREVDPLLDAAKSVPGTKVVDLTSTYCDADRCPAVIGGVIVYRDAIAHLTGTFSLTLGPRLATELRTATR